MKIIDFGSACYTKEEEDFCLMKTQSYSAPSHMKGSRRDVYSLGVILHQMTYKRYPTPLFSYSNRVFDGLIWNMLYMEYFECIQVLDDLQVIKDV